MKDEEVKKHILEAGMRVFRKWGFNKSTMEDIAAEAGKGKSTLYYYYKSKDEIFFEAVQSEIHQVILKGLASIKGVSSAKEQLRQYIVSNVTEVKNTTTLYTTVLLEMRSNRSFTDKIRSLIEPMGINAVRSILQYGITTSEFVFETAEEVDLAAKVIVGIINSMLLYLFLENNDSTQIDMAAKLIANGI